MHLSSKLNDTWIELTVSDTGVGISTENLKLIFDRFTQENMDYSREQEGTGLGLAISKGLAELLDGNILVSSQKGKGSTFTLRLPFTQAQEKKDQLHVEEVDTTHLSESIHAITFGLPNLIEWFFYTHWESSYI